MKKAGHRRSGTQVILYCTVLYWTVLYGTVLYRIVCVYCTVLYCMYCTVLYCPVSLVHNIVGKLRVVLEALFFCVELFSIAFASLRVPRFAVPRWRSVLYSTALCTALYCSSVVRGSSSRVRQVSVVQWSECTACVWELHSALTVLYRLVVVVTLQQKDRPHYSTSVGRRSAVN